MIIGLFKNNEAFERKNKKPGLEFNLGWAPVGLRTTEWVPSHLKTLMLDVVCLLILQLVIFLIVLSISRKSIFCPTVLEVQKAYRQNASDFYFDVHEWQTNINIASSNFADNGLYYLSSSVWKKLCFFKQRWRNFSWRTAHKFSQALLPKPTLIGFISFIAWRKYIDLSFSGSVVVGCVYKNLQDILPKSQPNRNGTGSTT